MCGDRRRSRSSRLCVLTLFVGIVLLWARTSVAVVEESWHEKVPKLPAPGPGSRTPSAPASAAPRATPAPTPDPAKELQKAKDLLKQVPEGADIVKFLEDKKIAIVFDDSDDSYYLDGKITLGPPYDAEDIALTLAHEGNHARADKEGRSADVKKDTRADYVRKMVEEEAIGTVASIEVKNALEKKGKTITATFPLEKEYDDAYKKAVDALKKAKPGASEAELDAAGKKAGLAAVKKGFETGKVVTGNTHEKYPDYYGKDWDAARKGKAPGPESKREDAGEPVEVDSARPQPHVAPGEIAKRPPGPAGDMDFLEGADFTAGGTVGAKQAAYFAKTAPAILEAATRHGVDFQQAVMMIAQAKGEQGGGFPDPSSPKQGNRLFNMQMPFDEFNKYKENAVKLAKPGKPVNPEGPFKTDLPGVTVVLIGSPEHVDVKDEEGKPTGEKKVSVLKSPFFEYDSLSHSVDHYFQRGGEKYGGMIKSLKNKDSTIGDFAQAVVAAKYGTHVDYAPGLVDNYQEVGSYLSKVMKGTADRDRDVVRKIDESLKKGEDPNPQGLIDEKKQLEAEIQALDAQREKLDKLLNTLPVFPRKTPKPTKK